MAFEIAPKETEIQANWDDAKFYCFNLNIDGKTDWRLPTLIELSEIFKTDNDFDQLAYWSATEKVVNFCNENCAWYFSFYNGYNDFANKIHSASVRSVRDLKDHRKQTTNTL